MSRRSITGAATRAAEPPRGQVDAGLSAAATIEAAAARAAEFLLAEREQDDFWRDFRLVNGASDEWVTAFVGYALATSGVPLPAGLVPQTVRALLRRQRPEGGWGYNRISPADSDSTAWALKFLRGSRLLRPGNGTARAFLLSHLRAEGGLSTYADDDEPALRRDRRRRFRLAKRPSVRRRQRRRTDRRAAGRAPPLQPRPRRRLAGLLVAQRRLLHRLGDREPRAPSSRERKPIARGSMGSAAGRLGEQRRSIAPG